MGLSIAKVPSVARRKGANGVVINVSRCNEKFCCEFTNTYFFKRSIKMSYITDTFDVIVVGAGHADKYR